MKKTLFICVAVLLCFGNYQPLTAQSQVGIGLSMSDFREIFQNIQGGGETAQNVYLPIYFSDSFRLEPHIGLSANSEEEDDAKRETTCYQFGLGIFTMNRNSQTAIYYGGRLGIILLKQTSEYHEDDNSDKYKSNGTGFFLSPVIGCEHFAAEKFSFGGEVHIKWIASTMEDEDHDKTELKNYYTGGLVFIRFYFNTPNKE